MEPEAIIGEYEFYRAQVEIYKKNIELIDSNLLDLNMVKESLDSIKKLKKNNEVLVPLGGGSFVKAKITDVKKVVIGLGADVAVKRTIPDAQTDIEKRISELEKVRADQTERLQIALSKVEELTPKVQEILAKARKEG